MGLHGGLLLIGVVMLSIISWALIMTHTLWMFAMVCVALDIRSQGGESYEPDLVVGSFAVYALHWYLFIIL